MRLFALDVQRGGMPGQPGADISECSRSGVCPTTVDSVVTAAITDLSAEERKRDMRLRTLAARYWRRGWRAATLSH
jgi:hypothetical protein